MHLYAIIIIMSTTLHSVTLLFFSLNAGSCLAVPVYVVAVIYEEVSYPLPRYEVNKTYYYYSRQGKNIYEKAPASKFNYFFTFINSNDYKVSFSRQ